MTATGAVPVLLLFAGGRQCAIPLRHVVETMRPLPIEPVSDPPRGVVGVSVIRGAPLPVVDLGTVLGSSDGRAPIPPKRFVTLRVGDRQVALAVDAVVGVRDLESSAMHDLPLLLRGSPSASIASLSALDRELVAVLDTGRLLVA